MTISPLLRLLFAPLRRGERDDRAETMEQWVEQAGAQMVDEIEDRLGFR